MTGLHGKCLAWESPYQTGSAKHEDQRANHSFSENQDKFGSVRMQKHKNGI